MKMTWRAVVRVLLLALETGALASGPPVFSQTDTAAPAKKSAEGDRLLHQGMTARRAGKMAECISLWEAARAAYARDLGPDYPDTLKSMNYLANAYGEVGRNAESARLQEETLALKRKTLGPDAPETLLSMANLAITYGNGGRHAEARKLREEILALRRRTLGAEHPDTLASMASVARDYRATGRYAEAVKLGEETLALRRKTLGTDHPATLRSAESLADSYVEVGRTAQALKLREETLALMRSKLGADHPDTLDSIASLAASYNDAGRYAEALKLSEDAMARWKKKPGSRRLEMLDCMHTLATSYAGVGRTVEALKLCEEILTISRNELGPEHPYTVTSMGILAGSYSAAGHNAAALKLREETLALRRKQLGPHHPATLTSMANLASSYNDVGRTAEALKLREEILPLRRRIIGADHPDTIVSINDLAASYRDAGRPVEALKLEEDIFTLLRKQRGADHPETLACMTNLASFYDDVGRHAEALKMREETLALQNNKLGHEHPQTLASMNNLTASYRAAGRYAEALKLGEETLALRRKTLGAEHPETFRSMSNLATTYHAAGQYAEALKLGEETFALRQKTLGVDHPDTLHSMYYLARGYREAGRRTESLALRRRSLDVIDRVAASLTTLPREERSTAMGSYLPYYTSFARDLAASPADHAEALTVTERAKARTLLEELTARRAIDNSGIPAADARRLAELRSSLEYIDGKLAAAPNDDDRTPLRTQRDASRVELDALHRALMAKYPRYAALSAVKPVTLEQGRAILPAHGAFISWLYDKRTAGVALALPKTGELQVIESMPGQQMTARAESYRWLLALPDADSFAKAVQTIPLAAWQEDGVLYIGAPDQRPAKGNRVLPSQYPALRQQAIRSHGQWLSDTLLKPLAARIDPASQWIISPDGVLATIPWDTLPWKGQPLGQQKQITVVQSLSVYKLLKDREADYAHERADAPDRTQALMVMGGAVYDAATNGQRSFQRAPQIVINGATTSAVEYQRQNAYDYMRSRHWPNLPGTLREATTLHSLMGGRMFTGRDASKTRLRELSQSGELATYRNLHFAAHGYLDTTVPSLSALVLTATGQDESNDGYITAGEWPAFRLRSDLLVMSACETGMGKVISGEGVQGMPYALYVAGNQDTLLSLWQVSDNATSLFMKRFWEKVKAGASHAQALTDTKREFQRGDAGKTYADPYYWAPFVLYGVQD
jgi:CHAT domain-containing protein